MSTSTAIDRQTSEALQSSIGGDVFVPGDHGFDEARQAWNLVADQRPAVVVLAGSAADVAHAVRFARADGMRIAPRAPATAPCRWSRYQLINPRLKTLERGTLKAGDTNVPTEKLILTHEGSHAE